MTVETLAFQAETKELLDLVIHSLYTHEEIFLRELISNASDALDKLRHEALTAPELWDEKDELKVELAVDDEARLLCVIDNGVGMSREEVMENLGTIARSGTKRFLDALKDAQSAPELIGQFGVGFYAAFMVADEVVVETRRAGEELGTRWSSDGKGEFSVEEVEKPTRGTTITLHLKPVESKDGAQDYALPSVLRQIVRRYSDFIEYPVQMLGEPKPAAEGEEAAALELETLNSQKPLWTRERSTIEAEEYAQFYRHLAHDWNDPLETVHFKAEGTIEYAALLFLPKQRPMDLFDPEQRKSRIALYVRRVFIMDECEELAPVWLRFVRGVVDSADLPLNVSRETLQHDRQVRQIQKRLTRKVLDALGQMLKNRRDEYATFWEAFGGVLKEGIYYEEELREEVARLSLFPSSKEDGLVTLDEYIERMPVKQKEIYVLPVDEVEAGRRSPHVEAFAQRGYEVLLMTDPVDEFVLQRLSTYEERPLRRIDQGEVDLEEAEEKAKRESDEKELIPVLDAVRKELSEHVEDVRFSARLTDSAACLVPTANALSPHMERMMRSSGQEIPPNKGVLELNARHPLVKRLGELSDGDGKEHRRFGDYCELLHGQALIRGGEKPKDAKRFSELLTNLMMG